MILIDENADTHLMKALEGLRSNAGENRCVHFNLIDNVPTLIAQDKKALQRSVVKFIDTHLMRMESFVFLCSAGDVFVISPNLSGKTTRHLVADVAAHLQVNSDKLAGFYLVQNQIDRIIACFEHGQSQQKHALEQAIKEKKEKTSLRKREEILFPSILNNHNQNIHERRIKRREPELMMIEDDTFSKKLVENLLLRQYHLTTLTETEGALITYTSLAPDILFLDIGLPNVSGHELLTRILTLDPNAFVIMLSGHGDRENVTRALELGAKGFIVKPFKHDKITEYINRCPTIRH